MKFFLLTDLSLLFSSYKSFLVIKTKKNITIIFLILSSNLLAQVDNNNVIVLKGKILKLEKTGNKTILHPRDDLLVLLGTEQESGRDDLLELKIVS